MAHRWLVEALGDRELLDLTQGARAVEPAAWSAALERVRQRRHPQLPVQEGLRRVGFEVGEAFLSSSLGLHVRDVLGFLSLESAMSLVTGLGARMRQGFVVECTNDTDSAVMTIRGAHAAPAEVTLGALQAFVACLPTPHEVTMGACDGQTRTFHVRRKSQ